MRVHSLILLVLLVLVIGIGIGALFYFYTSKEVSRPEVTTVKEPEVSYTYLRIFYPVGGRLEIFEKRIQGTLLPVQMAEILIKEYLELATEMDTGIIPEGVRVLNVFLSTDGTVYLNFNRTLKSRFSGDVLDEYMFLRSIYETMISNLDINDVVILVQGREEETLGGHFFVNRPLKEILSEEVH